MREHSYRGSQYIIGLYLTLLSLCGKNNIYIVQCIYCTMNPPNCGWKTNQTARVNSGCDIQK